MLRTRLAKFEACQTRYMTGYDFLVIATGSTAQFQSIPDAAQHTWSLKTLSDAIALHD